MRTGLTTSLGIPVSYNLETSLLSLDRNIDKQACQPHNLQNLEIADKKSSWWNQWVSDTYIAFIFLLRIVLYRLVAPLVSSLKDQRHSQSRTHSYCMCHSPSVRVTELRSWRLQLLHVGVTRGYINREFEQLARETVRLTVKPWGLTGLDKV